MLVGAGSVIQLQSFRKTAEGGSTGLGLGMSMEGQPAHANTGIREGQWLSVLANQPCKEPSKRGKEKRGREEGRARAQTLSVEGCTLERALLHLCVTELLLHAGESGSREPCPHSASDGICPHLGSPNPSSWGCLFDET